MRTTLFRLAVASAAGLALLAAGCGSSDSGDGGGSGSGSGGTAGARPKTVGVSMHFLADDYAKSFADTIKAKGRELGLDVTVSSADSDPQKQLSDLQSFVAKKVGLIVVIPIDEVAIVPGLKSAAKAGIPIIAASPVPGAADALTAVIGPSDFNNGKAACDGMATDMKSRNKGMDVAISTASVTLYRIDQRVEGCKAALDAAGAKVVDTARGLSPEEGLSNAQNLLSAHPDLDGIFGSFSNLVIGAGNAVKNANRTDVSVSGIDADRSIIQLITKGQVTDVAAQFPAEQATLIAKAAADVVNGKQVKKDQQDQLPSRTVDKTNAAQRYQEIWGEPLPTG
jgi:ribose transport system substrate-binding protein